MGVLTCSRCGSAGLLPDQDDHVRCNMCGHREYEPFSEENKVRVARMRELHLRALQAPLDLGGRPHSSYWELAEYLQAHEGSATRTQIRIDLNMSDSTVQRASAQLIRDGIAYRAKFGVLTLIEGESDTW